MANVRLIEDFGKYKAGEVVNLPATIARDLIYKNKALDGKAVSKGWKPEKVREKDFKPSKSNTVDEIKAYLDSKKIEYSSDAKKDKLLDLIDG